MYFIAFCRLFLVAFADSSLVTVPVDCKDVTLCEHIVWPKQPLSLHSSDGKSVVLYCEGGFACAFTFTAAGALSCPPVAWSEKSVQMATTTDTALCNSSARAFAILTPVSVSNSSVSATASKKKSKSESSNDLSLSVGAEMTTANLSVWNNSSALLEGTCALLQQKNATASTIRYQSTEKVVGVVCHNHSDSLSVLLSSTSGNGRWIKLALDGTVLFERALSCSVIQYCSETCDQLCVLSSDRVLSFWDVRYGTEVRRVALNDSSASSTVCASWVLVHQSDANYSKSGSSSTVPATMQLVTSKMIKTGGPYNLYRRALSSSTSTSSNSASNTTSTLCQSLGKLANTGETASVTSDNKRKQIGSGDETEGATVLTAAHKRKLHELRSKLDAQLEVERAQDLSGDLVDPALRSERKHRKLSFEVPEEVYQVQSVYHCVGCIFS